MTAASPNVETINRSCDQELLRPGQVARPMQGARMGAKAQGVTVY